MIFSQEKSQAAFDRVHELGGNGVWESDMVVISLEGTGVTDGDLSLFSDFDFVEILSLSDTHISDAGLVYLKQLHRLGKLTLVNTNVTEQGVAELRAALPDANIETEPLPEDAINLFTGKPFDE